ncbi:lipid A-modifier LpxR family protein [Litoreibacter halocynthiae]|uniref:lipid A-modifier LpxR family protein n=1 Tax=Litoreibacter halocynthiae TaxID=1242689 RepID=UPI0024909846|nr:lipid A-modifier LpxR family protein [Litoreibacter halocynthiae]
MTSLRILMATVMLLAVAGGASADGSRSLGWGSLFTNDAIGDNKDRWRSASFVVSHLRGTEWSGQRPDSFGALIEYRFRAEMITPVNVATPRASDRLYVGALSVGAHSHFQKGATEMSLGLGLVFVGPQTKVDQLQDELHGVFVSSGVNVDGFQVANAVYPTVTFEAGRVFALGGSGRVRPFVELQAGVETLARVGADVTFGGFGTGALLLRDSATGLLYTGIHGDRPTGLSFIMGGDVAYVADSKYLDTPGIAAKDMRARFRAGVHQQFQRAALFYGATYLSEEYESQPEGQVVGALSVNIQF